MASELGTDVCHFSLGGLKVDRYAARGLIILRCSGRRSESDWVIIEAIASFIAYPLSTVRLEAFRPHRQPVDPGPILVCQYQRGQFGIADWNRNGANFCFNQVSLDFDINSHLLPAISQGHFSGCIVQADIEMLQGYPALFAQGHFPRRPCMMLDHCDTRLATVDTRHDTGLTGALLRRRISTAVLIKFAFAIQHPSGTLHDRVVVPRRLKRRRWRLFWQLRHGKRHFAIGR